MTDTKDSTDKTIRGGRKQLSLQRTVESGHVRQSFSHGRSKAVVVEKRKSRKLATPGQQGAEEITPATPQQPAAPVARKPASAPPRPAPSADTASGDKLSSSEVEARQRALQAAKAAQDAEEAERKAREESQAKAEKESEAAKEPVAEKSEQPTAAPEAPPEPVEVAAEPAPPAVEEVKSAPAPEPAKSAPPAREQPRAKSSAAPARKSDGPQRGEGRPSGRSSEGDAPARQRAPRSLDTQFQPRERGKPKEIRLPGPPRGQADGGDEPIVAKPQRAQRPAPAPQQQQMEDEDGRNKRGGKPSRTATRTGDERRERGKLTVDQLLNRENRERSLASLKRKREREKLKAMGIAQPREKIAREVIIPEVITIQELANRMAERAVDLIKYLMKQGEMHKINDVIDADTAELLVSEFGHTSKRVSEADVEEGFIGETDADETLVQRAPVVTIMGHVDHGKTSLLDAIRKANVVSGEAGGITQHIGAYQVETGSGQKITFIDTPGHAAFTAMRARGAKVTDIVVLVVAADDGVMPQTIEAINHAKAADVPMIVAINKIDKPQADPNRVRTELLQHEVVVETMSGETLEVEVSALKQMNLDKLLEAIALQAEILDLKANPERNAEGIVIEAKLERGRGPVGTVLVQRGTLAVGDIVVAGTAWGRVRALIDDRGKNVAKAGPSVPVEVLGFDAAPEAGDQFAVVENEARAREITDYRVRKRREKLGSAGSPRTLEQMMQTLKDEAGKKEFPLVIKGDVQGSIEAIAGALKKMGTDEVEARIVHSGVGGITESDVVLANASNAVIFGFNVRANAQAKQAADSQGVEIRYYNIIYDLVDDVKAAMSGLLEPTIREIFLGNAEILQVFNITKVGKVAGCRVTEGKVERGAKVRLIRDNVVIHEGSLSILKRFKDDVKEVPVGQECGMSFANYQDLREGDVIECFQVETLARTL
ncbi:translation initiation factor IF-2 [Filomicrobium sp.]|uniref:translation initiation factor IF-2 n=1 Tax=Filomicrobium sp. TaxID=2024831 RepID=UPI002584C10E|nr:translation initiation factor IF-2 [Filomicrobium sp.]MCV0370037.1 translation initiation factor IF-2 [Filomicrobium sp.]